MRSFSKSRNVVTRSGGILRGLFPSQRFNKNIKWEGENEKSLLYLLEFSPSLKNFKSQPFRATFEYAGKLTSRTPDFLIETDDEDILVECKSQRSFDNPEVKEHLNIGRAYFEDNNYRYLVLTDTEIRSTSSLENARMLFRYLPRANQKAEVIQENFRRLRDQMIGTQFLTFRDAKQILRDVSNVYELMASGSLYFDFKQDFCLTTKLSCEPFLENHDASAFLLTR